MLRRHHDCHHHGHAHGPANYNLAFAVGVILNGGYILFEAGFGFAIGSLSLLADAGHNLSDLLGLLMAWGAHYLGQLQPTERHTYGWRSSTILAALTNGVLLVLAMGGILWEAVGRLGDPQPMHGTTIIWVAALGVVINACTAAMFLKGREKDINIRAAYLHMAADAGVSLAVVLGGIGIVLWQWNWLDPILSIGIALVILFGTWGLLRDAVNLALHAVPRGIDAREVQDFLEGREGVHEVHDLHIWAMSTTESALTVHLVMPDLTPEDNDAFLFDTAHELESRFTIAHATIQIERSADSDSCRLKPADVV